MKKDNYITKTIIQKKKPKKLCKICESKNKGIRYHPETTCWFKTKDNENKNCGIKSTTLNWRMNQKRKTKKTKFDTVDQSENGV